MHAGLGFSVILSSENIIYVAEVKSFKYCFNELQFCLCDILLQAWLPFTLGERFCVWICMCVGWADVSELKPHSVTFVCLLLKLQIQGLRKGSLTYYD